jgi:hypothetical protein
VEQTADVIFKSTDYRLIWFHVAGEGGSVSKQAKTKHLVRQLEMLARELFREGEYLSCRQLVEALKVLDQRKAIALRDELFCYEKGQP